MFIICGYFILVSLRSLCLCELKKKKLITCHYITRTTYISKQLNTLSKIAKVILIILNGIILIFLHRYCKLVASLLMCIFRDGRKVDNTQESVLTLVVSNNWLIQWSCQKNSNQLSEKKINHRGCLVVLETKQSVEWLNFSLFNELFWPCVDAAINSLITQNSWVAESGKSLLSN